MSSPTCLFVARARPRRARPSAAGETAVLSALGPGFCAEYVRRAASRGMSAAGPGAALPVTGLVAVSRVSPVAERRDRADPSRRDITLAACSRAGAREHGARALSRCWSHMHALSSPALVAEVLCARRAAPALACALARAARLGRRCCATSAMRALGPFWTTRVIVLDGARRCVRHGPYRCLPPSELPGGGDRAALGPAHVRRLAHGACCSRSPTCSPCGADPAARSGRWRIPGLNCPQKSSVWTDLRFYLTVFEEHARRIGACVVCVERQNASRFAVKRTALYLSNHALGRELAAAIAREDISTAVVLDHIAEYDAAQALPARPAIPRCSPTASRCCTARRGGVQAHPGGAGRPAIPGDLRHGGGWPPASERRGAPGGVSHRAHRRRAAGSRHAQDQAGRSRSSWPSASQARRTRASCRPSRKLRPCPPAQAVPATLNVAETASPANCPRGQFRRSDHSVCGARSPDRETAGAAALCPAGHDRRGDVRGPALRPGPRLSHELPAGDVAAVLRMALKALVPELERRRFAATDQPRAARQQGLVACGCIPAHGPAVGLEARPGPVHVRERRRASLRGAQVHPVRSRARGRARRRGIRGRHPAPLPRPQPVHGRAHVRRRVHAP